MSLYLRKSHIPIWIVVILFAAFSCSTEKNAWPNRAFHDMIAHYNGYFNAGEIIKETMFDFRENRKDDFTKILPVYEIPNDEESKALYAPMDTAAKKCETVISRNSMPNEKKGQSKREEWCKWIDDNWLVIGESKFYKRDFDKAETVFTYIRKNYKSSPIIYEATIWLARTYIEEERYTEAEDLLKDLEKQKEDRADLVEEQKAEEQKAKERAKKRGKKYKKSKGEDHLPPEFPKDLEKKLAPIYADLYLRQKDYKKAEEWLVKAIELTKKKPFKARLTFILAQIKQKQGSPEASALYARVIQLNPEYDMAFQAKIQRALAYSGGDSKSVKTQLLKMLKDDKNAEYLDQIYYALADIEIRGGNKQKGIEYLEKSVANSVSNNGQKSKSFLRLGKLYYEEKNYIKAQQYYDSTMAVLPKTHEEYDLIESQNKSLTELVDNLKTASEADSLLNLCSKSEKEIVSQIEDMIQQKKIAKQKAEEAQQNSNMNMAATKPTGGNATPGSKFWIWDNNLRAIGFTEFRKVWGNRKLEDNWRRSDKTSLEDTESDAENDSTEAQEYSVEYYLSQLPCGDEEKTNKLKEDLIASLYNSGMIYKVKFDDKPAAISAFQQLSNNYLPHEKAIAGMYQLYLMTTGDEKNKWKDKILNDYPDTEYAKLIKDPYYKEKENALKNSAEKDYSKVFQLYSERKYKEVVSECDKEIKDTTNPLTCKYRFLKANALGMLYANKKDSLFIIEDALEDIVSGCKDSPYEEVAQASLDKLRNINSLNDAKSGKSTYIYAPEIQHYLVLVIPNGKGNSMKIKTAVSDFNRTSFAADNLKTSSSFLDLDNQLVLVKSFPNKDAAMDYYTAFKVNKTQLKGFNTKLVFFVITAKNYASFFIEKKIDEYLKFFNENYLK